VDRVSVACAILDLRKLEFELSRGASVDGKCDTASLLSTALRQLGLARHQRALHWRFLDFYPRTVWSQLAVAHAALAKVESQLDPEISKFVILPLRTVIENWAAGFGSSSVTLTTFSRVGMLYDRTLKDAWETANGEPPPIYEGFLARAKPWFRANPRHEDELKQLFWNWLEFG
jgi:hypothetical protein